MPPLSQACFLPVTDRFSHSAVSYATARLAATSRRPRELAVLASASPAARSSPSCVTSACVSPPSHSPVSTGLPCRCGLELSPPCDKPSEGTRTPVPRAQLRLTPRGGVKKRSPCCLSQRTMPRFPSSASEGSPAGNCALCLAQAWCGGTYCGGTQWWHAAVARAPEADALQGPEQAGSMGDMIRLKRSGLGSTPTRTNRCF